MSEASGGPSASDIVKAVNGRKMSALEVTEAAIDEIARRGYDPTFGARPLKRVIQQQVQNPLATEILKGEFPEGSVVRLDFRDGEFAFEREEQHEPVAT